MPGLYEIITELRREHPTPAAARTLDMVNAELGRTHENLRVALEHISERSVPSGGAGILEELWVRARRDDLEDVTLPTAREEVRAAQESVDGSQVGIAVLLGGTALAGMVLAVAVTVGGLNQIFHWF